MRSSAGSPRLRADEAHPPLSVKKPGIQSASHRKEFMKIRLVPTPNRQTLVDQQPLKLEMDSITALARAGSTFPAPQKSKPPAFPSPERSFVRLTLH